MVEGGGLARLMEAFAEDSEDEQDSAAPEANQVRPACLSYLSNVAAVVLEWSLSMPWVFFAGKRIGPVLVVVLSRNPRFCSGGVAVAAAAATRGVGRGWGWFMSLGVCFLRGCRYG